MFDVILALLLTFSAYAMPNQALTPGRAITDNVTTICRPGYAHSVRPVGQQWRLLSKTVYIRYGFPNGRHPPYAYEMDHLIPIEIGGDPSSVENLWPQPISQAREKDQIEDELHRRVCSGKMNIHDAQTDIAKDWRIVLP